MSIIINPNAPPPARQRSDLDNIIDTMRVIAMYRQKYLTIDAALRIDDLTATQIDELHTAQEQIAVELLHFIMTGEKLNAVRPNVQATDPNIKENAIELTPSAQE